MAERREETQEKQETNDKPKSKEKQKTYIDIGSIKENVKEDLPDIVKRLVIITIASLIMAIDIKWLVNAGGIFPGGASGLTLLIQRYLEITFHIAVPYTIINVLMNLGPVYIGFRYIGKKFTIYSCVTIMMTNIFTDLIPAYVITTDMLLVSIFGGLISGFAISLCLRGDTTTGGTDFIAIFLSEKKGMDSFPVVLGINAVSIGIAGFLFGWDKAMYSIIFQYAATQVLHLLYRQYQQLTFFVVTNKKKEVSEVIYAATNHGATLIDAAGGYEGQERTIVYSVVSSAQSKKLLKKIKEIDPEAFINMIKTERISGHFYLKKYD